MFSQDGLAAAGPSSGKVRIPFPRADVSDMTTEQINEDRPAESFVGGARWGFLRASANLVRLTVSPLGITLRPRPAWRVWRIFGAPWVDASWDEIGRVGIVTQKLTNAPTVAFDVRGKSLYWWAPGDHQRLLDAVAQQAPEKISVETRRRFIF